MKAVILKDEDAVSLLEQLELTNLRKKEYAPNESKAVADSMHRSFHFVVTRWLQEHGFNTLRN